MDGVNNTEAITGSVTVTPIVDDIQEFKVVSHDDATQYGGATGGYINVITKSGTNQFRGELWEFLRNSDFDARDPFFTKVNPLRQNQFGANFGGPVLIPKMYNGRNKTFFFASYEGFRQSQASQTLYVVPTAAQLGGDLSGISGQIYNPFTTAPDPNHPGQLIRQPFPGNIIPASVLDPNMVKFAELVYPRPVQTAVAGYNGLDNTPYTHNANTYNLRGDEYLTQHDQIWAHFIHQTSPVSQSGGFVGLVTDTGYDAYNLGLSWVHTFGPTSLITVSFGRNLGEIEPTTIFKGDVQSILSQTGFSTSFVCGFTYGFRNCMLPSMSVSGYVGGGENDGSPNYNSDVYEWKADYSKVAGKHTIYTGFNVDTNNQGAAASVSASETFSAFETSNLETSQGGNALASFLSGVPDSASRGNILNYEHSGFVNGAYIQDQWKVTDRLTLNLGLRYDVTLIPVIGLKGVGDYYGATNFYNGTYIIQNLPPPCSSTQFAPCIPNGTLPANVVVSSNGKLYQNDYRNIQPRVGVAYRVGQKSVIRASYGRFYDNWAAVDQAAQNVQSWPTVADRMAQNLNPGYPTVSAENPFVGNSGLYPTPAPFNQLGWNNAPQFRAPYSDQWNFGIQHQFATNAVATLNYVGSHDVHTDIGPEMNTALVPGPGNPLSRAPYPYITPSYFDQSIGLASYQAFQFSLQQSTTKGLTYLVSYTWSKTIDVASDGWFCSEGCSIENPYDLNGSRSVAGFDLPQMLSISANYQLPVGKGHFLSTGNRVADYILGNWTINGIASLHSGVPYTLTVCGDIANTGNGSCYERPNLVGNPALPNPTPALWFNTSAFASPAPYTYGDLGRNTMRSDAFKNLDFSLFREFPISEARRFEFRFEAFNIFNHPTWGTPNSVLNQNNFGVISTTQSTERQLQLALKFYF